MVLFASIIAPFGGFFASGLKRALQIKDFGDIIPGHGGVVDRFDCMNLMMIFISLYLSEIIKGRSHSINSVSQYIERLSREDQEYLYTKLQYILYTN